jgi:hypothetical protein
MRPRNLPLERRRSPRKPVSPGLRAYYRVLGVRCCCQVRNVSRRGAFVEITHPSCEEGRLIELVFAQFSDKVIQVRPLRGFIIHSSKSGAGVSLLPRYGLRRYRFSEGEVSG